MFKLKSKIKGENATIPTYFEVVVVKDGIATCNSEAAKNHLLGLGFEIVTGKGKTKNQRQSKGRKGKPTGRKGKSKRK